MKRYTFSITILSDLTWDTNEEAKDQIRSALRSHLRRAGIDVDTITPHAVQNVSPELLKRIRDRQRGTGPTPAFQCARIDCTRVGFHTVRCPKRKGIL